MQFEQGFVVYAIVEASVRSIPIMDEDCKDF